MVKEELPPHDIDAERCVLGAMMLSEEIIPDVFELLGDRGDDFLRPAHGMIYKAIIDLWDTGITPDVQLVVEGLRKREELLRCGGPLYVFGLAENVPTVSNGVMYAGTVAEQAARSRAATVLERGLKDVVTTSSDLGRVIDTVTSDLTEKINRKPPKEVSSWTPIDLGPYLRGERVQAEPTVGLCRSDGVRMIYPGKEHSIIGETESGKSWFATASAATEMQNGNVVVYIHFEESDPADTVERLRLLHVPDDVIASKLRFVGPEAPVQPRLIAALLADSPTLVILDGVNEGMSLHGCDTRHEDGVAQFRRRVVKPCTAAGAATLAGDHVVKDREQRGRSEMGSIHKGNGLTGARILLETIDPFGRGKRGASAVYVTKDRPGFLRRSGKSDKLPGKTFMGVFSIDDTRLNVPFLELGFHAPSDEDPVRETQAADARTEADDDHIFQVVAEIIQDGQPASGRKVRARSSLGTNKTIDALERLVLDGRLDASAGPKGATHYTPASGPGDRRDEWS